MCRNFLLAKFAGRLDNCMLQNTNHDYGNLNQLSDINLSQRPPFTYSYDGKDIGFVPIKMNAFLDMTPCKVVYIYIYIYAPQFAP